MGITSQQFDRFVTALRDYVDAEVDLRIAERDQRVQAGVANNLGVSTLKKREFELGAELVRVLKQTFNVEA